MTEKYENVTQEEIQHLMRDDKAFVSLANDIRIKLTTSPTQSNFRVVAILIVRYEGSKLRLVVGANCEQGYIGGAICAERSAICRLRFLDRPEILRIVVVTDSEVPISPGALCREFLMSAAAPDTPVVIGNNNGEEVTECTVGQIWPFPYLYRLFLRQDIIPQVAVICQEVQSKASKRDSIPSSMQSYIDQAVAAAKAVNANDRAERLHPVRFSAALIYEDSSVQTAWILKGLEYGCTMDPVLQVLAKAVQRRAEEPSGPAPVLLVMMDQFEVLHAPFAQARALLVEHGFSFLQVAVHDEQGFLRLTTAQALYPPPGKAHVLTHDSFTLCSPPAH